MVWKALRPGDFGDFRLNSFARISLAAAHACGEILAVWLADV